MLTAFSLPNPNSKGPAFSHHTQPAWPTTPPLHHVPAVGSQDQGTAHTGRRLIPRDHPLPAPSTQPGTEQGHVEVSVNTGRGRVAPGARWRAWASCSLPPVMGLPVLTPSNPLSSRRRGFTSKFIRIIWTMMSWTHVPTGGPTLQLLSPGTQGSSGNLPGLHGSPTLPQLPSEPGKEPGLPHLSWHPTQDFKCMERRAESESSKVSSILTRCATSGAPNSPCLNLPFHRKGSGQNSPEGLLTHRTP